MTTTETISPEFADLDESMHIEGSREVPEDETAIYKVNFENFAVTGDKPFPAPIEKKLQQLGVEGEPSVVASNENPKTAAA